MLHIVYLVAITAEAMTGAMSAGRRQMDLFGVCFVATVTALGGGSVRDVLLGHYPLSWVAHPEYLWYTAAAALVTTLIARALRYLRLVFLMVDALGLVAFTLIGCDVALRLGHAPTIVVVAGVITGVCGGILRDIFCGDIPLVFRRELYASVSALVGVAYVALQASPLAHGAQVVICLIGGFLLRAAAIRFDWKVPRFVYHDDGGH
uniref:trimeric intracellular cation channel family protein n=1 Tax=Chitinasiproducens palmae TaxID=1770053 RepID=UPI0038B3929F